MNKMSRKTKIRVFSFAVAAVLAVGGLCISSFAAAEKYSTMLGTTYERNLSELSEHVSSIENHLKKGRYSVTSSGASELSMKLWSEALAAKTCLSGLPTSGTDLDNTYKFLSQVGEFSLSLSKKISAGDEISDEERKTLEKLLGYAADINAELDEMCLAMNEDGKWAENVKNSIYETGNDNDNVLESGFNNMEDHLSDYPTMLYDGPFSDHILQAKAKYIEGKSDVTKDDAAQKAAKMLDVPAEHLIFDGEEQGVIPCYNFSYDSSSVSVTKQGGYCSYILTNRDISESVYQYEECLEKAERFIEGLNIGDFSPSYYSLNEGICVINFAYTENSVVYYTDLIKIGIATDTGDVVSFNAQGFIMNHCTRNFSAPKNDISAARNKLSPLLSVKSETAVVIPLDTMEERLCYEFLCGGENGEEILVYINADTLEEEKILIVLKTDGGVLTK